MTTFDTEDLDYGADTLGSISALLAGYSGGITIVREMAQNADDVPGDEERWLEFHFEPEQLIIKNNTSFRPVDFDNIRKIARGGKKLEQRSTIGTFGVGFVSVYQLTDKPILRSSGRQLQFSPATGKVHSQSSDVSTHTEFELPYRRQPTLVGSRLDMPPVTDLWVHDILEQLPTESYRLLFFLRRLGRITVYEHGRLVSDVRREIMSAARVDQPELLTLTATDALGQTTQFRWLRFTSQVRAAAPRRTDGRAAKDSKVQIIVPDSDVPDSFLHERMPGRLYNYLPTDIETKLPFQINGDFYPSTDRKSIDNDHPHHRDWNTWVLKTLGECLAAALPVLLQRFDSDPLKLYQRLPIKPATPLVEPIVERFFEAARSQPIFLTVGGWRAAEGTRWVAKELRPVAASVDLRLMLGQLQSAAWELIHKLGVKEYTLADHLRRLTTDLELGQALAKGPNYLRNREQLDALYAVFEHESARPHDRQIAAAPVFLDHQGLLWPATSCVQTADAVVHKALADSGLHFWAGDPTHCRYTAALVPPFALSQLWNVLGCQLQAGIALDAAPAWLNTRPKLTALYDTVLHTRMGISKAAIAGLPICLDRENHLRRPSDVYLAGSEPVLYEILEGDTDAPLVDRSMNGGKTYRALYEEFGVRPFGWEMLFERLGKLAKAETVLHQAHACFNSHEKLLRVYRYLRDHREAFETRHLQELIHRLPIWLCRDNRLRIAKDLALPPDTPDWPQSITVDRVVQVERRDNLHPLLEEKLGLKPLDTARFIEQNLLPQYAALNQKQQMEALKYLRAQTLLLRENPPLLQAVRSAALIYGSDDQLHRTADLCFPRAGLLNLFPNRFSVPSQPLYAPPPGDIQAWIWYDFFWLLGVNQTASPQVVLEEIGRLTLRPPRQTRDDIEKLFRYLEEQWENIYARTTLGPRLRDTRWLPADGDADHWYRPSELYSRTDKPLVDRVAQVLGLISSQRPQKGIADALGFPSADVKLVVKQLLKLSELGVPPTDYLYDFLNRATTSDEDLKPLRGMAVIYDRDQECFRKIEHIFLLNHKRQFGAYRYYVVEGGYRALFRRMGAREQPIARDYVDLVREIGQQCRGIPVPLEEQRLLTNAYNELSSAPSELLAPLRQLPIVLSKAGDEEFVLRLPASVLLYPPELYLEYLPDLPIARYEPRGEQMLRAIGVRAIEDDGVLTVDFPFTPNTSQPISVASRFSPLLHAIQRLLHHHTMIDRAGAVLDQIKQIKGYTQPNLSVRYKVHLGTQKFVSELLNKNVYYDQQLRHMYLRADLKEQDLTWALAEVLHQILGIQTLLPLLLQTLIADPHGAARMLDRNHIKPLPPEFASAPMDETPILSFSLGTETAGLFDEEDFPQRPVPPTAPPDAPKIAQPSFPNGNHAPAAGPNGAGVSAGTKQPSTVPSSSNGAKVKDSPTKQVLPAAAPKPVTPSLPPMPNRPAATPARPEFAGRSKLSSPNIPTDIDGLCSRARVWAEARGLPTAGTANELTAPLQPRQPTPVPAEPTQINVVRFVLSFAEVEQGFLRLNQKALQLFGSRPESVRCATDLGHSFTLWIDWKRETKIAYNQTELARFFAEQAIPAGGIVYLERLHADEFRLFYHAVPHCVRAVRIGFNDQGQVRYETIEEVEVNCETVEAIYRAEKRHEDQAALWLEAVGKKSIEETISDLLMAAPDGWLHQDDLAAMVVAERQVAASTVPTTLRSTPFFATDGNGNWRLDPAALLATPRRDVVNSWRKVTKQLLDSDDVLLGTAITVLRPALDALRGRLLQIESHTRPAQMINDADSLLVQLIADPHNDLAASGIEQLLHEWVTTPDVDPAEDPRLRGLLQQASPPVWESVLRPALRKELEAFQKAHAYDRAAALAQSWADFDPAHGLDLEQIANAARAWRLINVPKPSVKAILEALILAPALTITLPKLHATLQIALQEHGPDYWLAHGLGEQAAAQFYVYIAELRVAYCQLTHDHKEAFDRTAQQQVERLWPRLDDQGKLVLGLQFAAHAPTGALAASQLSDLIRIALQIQDDHLIALLLGMAIWKQCPAGHPLQAELCRLLAERHIALGAWELGNGRPWKRLLDQQAAELHADRRRHTPADQQIDRLTSALHEGCLRNAATHFQREQALLDRLQMQDTTLLGTLLAVQRQELAHVIERDIQSLALSAA